MIENFVKNTMFVRVVLGCAVVRFQFQLRFWDMKTLKKIQAATISWNNLEGQKLHYKTFHTGHEEGMRREENKKTVFPTDNI